MRIKNSLYNIGTSFASQIIMIVLGFMSRTVFINVLGAEYLGINGLFTNILGIISLAESGIGSSIVYSLYKPVADKNEEKILALINLYKKAFKIIGLIVFVIGLSIMPFIKNMMNGGTVVKDVYVIYFIFIFNSSLSYLFSYKISFLNVCQKNYIVTSISTIFSVISTIIKIIILVFTENYILYLLVDTIITIVSQITLSSKVDKLYPYLKSNTDKKIDNETKVSIKKNIKALVIHNIGGRAVFGTDNLIISTFVSLASVGLYNNYLMFINLSRTLINTVFNGIEHSFGDLIAGGDKEKVYKIYKVMELATFWLNSFFAISMYVCLEHIIKLWLGKDYLMGQFVVATLMVSFYVSGMRRAITIVKTKSGIYHEDRFAPLLEAVINLIASIILVRYLGISGVFIGTILSTLLVPFWIAPYLVFKNVFNKSSIIYFKQYLIYAVIAIITAIITTCISNFISGTSLMSVIMKIIVASILPNIIYIAIFYNRDEFKYLNNIANIIFINKLTNKFKKVNKI